MDLGSENLDFIKLVNIKGSVENITPHKIAVVAFIREYGLLKVEAKKMVDCSVAPKYRKDFCMLALKLIQCPDMEFKELETLLTDGRYNLLSVHLQNFCVRLQNIYVNGISALMDCVTSTVDKLMIEQSETNPCVIARYSVLGLYLRRILLHLDKLTFVQVKLNNMEPVATISSTPTADETKPLELSMRMNIIDRDNSFEECQWSSKQAELFTAQQANLLQINEKKALSPKHFLNCIRMNEFCGAQDSLYNCFDRTVFNIGANGNGSEKNKSFRYAALNRAAMHTQFGHNAQTPRAPRHAAVAVQLVAQHVAVMGAKPADVFQIITKGDSLNYLHSMTDLTIAGLANTAALWSLYGKTEMASVTCQLLLNLNTSVRHGRRGRGRSDGETRGRRRRTRGTPQCTRHRRALWESQLLKAEMYFLKGDATEAQESLQDILDYCKNEDDSLHFMTLRLKAIILLSQVQHSFSSIQSTNIMLLNEALSLARKYHLHYLAATVEMHIANVQLSMGCAKNSLMLCRVATAPTSGEARAQVINSCCQTLETVKNNFSKIGSHVRLLQTWYLQEPVRMDVPPAGDTESCRSLEYAVDSVLVLL
ncbi:Anaphase-promoting complex subunit 5 [Operophtera brumata]|uniref:Anaphase-promoting complex subunit 5 n=1 Tax=Operophtera brumata TaxID=104452 RepID=A0A0L7LKW7_OPEBR|nr:Anaphase-promoting complex subunit 5 [Operophtera brumata]